MDSRGVVSADIQVTPWILDITIGTCVRERVGHAHIAPYCPSFVFASLSEITCQVFLPGPKAAIIDETAGKESGSSVTRYTVPSNIKTLSKMVKPTPN